MYALLRKEINVFFSSSTGYVVILVFLMVNGLFLWIFPFEYNIFDYGVASLETFFNFAPWVFLFLIPALTMRSYSEEKHSGTLELLITKPLSNVQVVVAKYLGSMLLLVIALIPTIVYVVTIYELAFPTGNLDWGGILGSYLGLIFLGAGLISIGLFTSSLSESPVVAFLIAFLLCGFIYTGFDFIYSLSFFGHFDLFIRNLGIQSHYLSISRGVVDTRDLIYFISLIILFIALTIFKTAKLK